MAVWSVQACAKINLRLRIVGRRTDGYHEIDTIFLQISLADRLFFEKTSTATLQLSCNWREIPCDGSNLCTRAYALLTQKFGQRFGVRLRLEKSIPVGAGLGGGSSDAAVTLMALNQMWQLGLSLLELDELARSLGSDVPFFLRGGLYHGTGRGEILTEIQSQPTWWVLVIAPGIMVSTAWAYQNFKFGLTNEQENSTFSTFSKELFHAEVRSLVGQNDFERVVFTAHPELAMIKSALLNRGALAASLTGSGAAVYGLFDSFEQAQTSRQSFHSKYTSFLARPIKWGKDEIDECFSSNISGG